MPFGIQASGPRPPARPVNTFIASLPPLPGRFRLRPSVSPSVPHQHSPGSARGARDPGSRAAETFSKAVTSPRVSDVSATFGFFPCDLLEAL